MAVDVRLKIAATASATACCGVIGVGGEGLDVSGQALNVSGQALQLRGVALNVSEQALQLRGLARNDGGEGLHLELLEVAPNPSHHGYTVQSALACALCTV